MSLGVLVVDDEPLARDRAAGLVETLESFHVAGRCANGLEAVEHIRRASPDIVLLDVCMPGLDGLGVIERLGVERMPPVVFLTAHDDYAVRAFDVRAVDYVEKPWARERLVRALDRAADARRESRSRIVLRAGGRSTLVAIDEIDWIESAGNYARVHAAGGVALSRETLTSIHERLPRRDFARIHRGTLVALGRVRELATGPVGEPLVVLADGTRLRVGRRFHRPLRTALTGSETRREGEG